MNKKLLVVAVAGALGAASALPANAEVDVIAKMYPAFVTYSGSATADGKTATSTISDNGAGNVDHDEIDSFNSYLRFSGEVDAGGGIKGFMQVEGALNFENGGRSFPSRNSAAGIKGGFGSVRLGQWDTPFKQLHIPVGGLGISSGSPVSHTGIISSTPYGDGADSFHRRQRNSVQYWSPSANGLQVKVAYGVDESKTATTDATLVSASVTYEAGPLMVGVAHESHDDFFGGSDGLAAAFSAGVTNSKDTGLALTAEYKLGKQTSIGFDYEDLTYENTGGSAGALREYSRTAMNLGVEHKIGNGAIGFSFGTADEGDCSLVGGAPCTTSGLGATQMSLIGMYNLAKNLSVYGWYTKIDNDPSASYELIGSPPTGSSPTAMAVGILAKF